MGRTGRTYAIQNRYWLSYDNLLVAICRLYDWNEDPDNMTKLQIKERIGEMLFWNGAFYLESDKLCYPELECHVEKATQLLSNRFQRELQETQGNLWSNT